MKNYLIAVFAFAAAVAGAADYPYRAADITNVVVTGGFWLPRVETNRLVTVRTDFRKCEDSGMIANFENAGAGKWGTFKGLRYLDADVFKILEGAAYTLATHPDPELDRYLDELIAKIASAQEPDGYLYTARTLGHFAPKTMGATRWSAIFDSHEIFNMGELCEAAVAHHAATGKTNLLAVARRAADLLVRTFGPGETQLKDAPGHEAPELALCRLYRTTGDESYLRLAKFFIDQRGSAGCTKRNAVDFVQPQDVAAKSDATLPGAYGQYHKPVVDQREAVGHAVRAAYLYCGLTDVAALTGDPRYLAASDAIWENVVGRKLHLTGGIGARSCGEAFGVDYELPNDTAYLETCAALANALWNQRMFLSHGDAKYADVLERILYNGFLSGTSLGGDEFFYPNPLATKGGYARSKWFQTSCCPSNVVRLFPQIATFAYATRGDAAYLNLFVDSTARLALAGGVVALKQTTDYPWKGTSRVVVTPAKDGQRFALNVRIPGWCVGRPVPSDLYTQVVPGSASDFSVKVNGEAVATDAPQKGYCVIDRAWKAGDVVEIEMAMPVRRIRAHAKVEADRGRLAVERGPVVYCAEGADNGGKAFDATLPADASFADATVNVNGATFPALRSGSLTLIPYFAWCHRGAGEMQTWFRE